MSENPTFEATFPDGGFRGTLKVGNETISVCLKEIVEEERFTVVDSPLTKRTIAKRKFVLIEE